jgi:hypothetical protein
MLCFKCPNCWEKFRVEVEKVPRYCPLCGFDSKEDEIAEETRMAEMLASQKPPAYKKQNAISGTVDKLYTDIEKTSETRAEMAAEAAGVDVSEMASLKVTDMKDSLRTGDIAAKPALNNNQKELGRSAGFSRNGVIEELRTNARQGPMAGTGVGTMSGLQQRFFGRTPEHFDGKPTGK